MTGLRIVADENIPLLEEFFSGLGTITRLPGREISARQVRDSDVLLVRSVTTVNEPLLRNSAVQFVGSCTIGVDHLDLEYLQSRKIHWSNAPGCNANSVVEYVCSALARLRPDWLDATFGIVGCGNVGGRLHRLLRALDVRCRVFDPFLSGADNPDLGDLDEVLQCEVVCLHAPLTQTGPHPSYHLLDATRLQRLPEHGLLISAGRGAVVDNQALKQVLIERQTLQAVLDVWEPEPDLDVELLQRVRLASPHVAGYSYDGKVMGTAMIYRALLQYLRRPVESLEDLLRERLQGTRNLRPRSRSRQAALNEVILGALDISLDDAQMRGLAKLPSNERGAYFDTLRKHYRMRREFHGFRVVLADDVEERSRVVSDMRRLGFQVD